MPKPVAFEGFPEAHRPAYGPFRAYVNRVRDGDTVELVVDIGFDRYPVVAIRLKGAWVAESDEPGGPDATAFLEEVLPHGTHVVVSSEKLARSLDQARTFDRYAGRITLLSGAYAGLDLSTLLVDLGYASETRGGPLKTVL